MIKDLKFHQERLNDLAGKLLLPIQIERNIDILMLAEFISIAKELARILKGCELIPKSTLNVLNMTKKALHAEIPYLRSNADSAIKMTNEIEYIFDLIILGECCEDRVPGVPRII